MTSAQKLERAARKAALAREALHVEIRAARLEGLPLRTIAAAAGVSHEQVRVITQKELRPGLLDEAASRA